MEDDSGFAFFEYTGVLLLIAFLELFESKILLVKNSSILKSYEIPVI